MASPQHPVARTPVVSLAVSVAVAVVSAVAGLCAGLVSRGAWRPGSVTIPWGLALAVMGSVALVVVARAVAGRSSGFLAAAAWVAAVASTLVWHPGGDYLFANDALGISFLLLATGAVLVTAGWGG
jgi:steroid 5-alpha reductase family enzyme